eukprot:1137796-Pelagomonas_calceolata.AAC.4
MEPRRHTPGLCHLCLEQPCTVFKWYKCRGVLQDLPCARVLLFESPSGSRCGSFLFRCICFVRNTCACELCAPRLNYEHGTKERNKP